MLKKISGPKTEVVTGCWRILHEDELQVLYCSLITTLVIKSRKIRWVTCMGQKENAYWVLVRKHERKRLLGRPRCIQKNINSSLKKHDGRYRLDLSGSG